MGNIKYNEELYNENIKNQFCEDNEYTGNSKVNATRIFRASADSEYFLGKDLYEFNREELKRLFYKMKPRTPGGSRQNVGWVLNYINWAIKKGHFKGLNPLSTVDKEWKEQFYNKDIKMLWTDTEINEIMKKLKNYPDRCIIALLFSGVKGEENAEITNLTKDDINDKTCELTLRDKDGSIRVKKVEKKIIDLCLKTASATFYDVANGTPLGPITHYELIPSRYVIKPANTNNSGDIPKTNIIFRSLTMAAERELGGEPHFNPTQILLSGLLYKAKNIYVKNGKFTESDATTLLEKEGFKPTPKYMDVLNEETIKSVYGL